jgi:hypothetical protein
LNRGVSDNAKDGTSAARDHAHTLNTQASTFGGA